MSQEQQAEEELILMESRLQKYKTEVDEKFKKSSQPLDDIP